MKNIIPVGILCFAAFISLNGLTSNADEYNSHSVILGDYESIVYLIENSDNSLQFKVARNINGDPSDGGITGDSDQLQTFSIPIKYNFFDDNIIYNIKIIPESGQSEVCNKIEIIPSKNKIDFKPFDIALTSATNCKFILNDYNNIYISSFNILINYTLKSWLNVSNNNTQAHRTALFIASELGSKNVSEFRALNLAEKNIDDISPITGFYNLKIINLSENNIKKIPLGIFDNFKNLNWLWLHFNKIKKLPLGIFDQLNNLDFLTLNDNKIKKLPHGLFQKLENLELLELSNNQLKKFPSDIMSLKKLISFGISSNKIRKIPKNVFVDMSRLTYIALDNNRLKSLPKNIFNDLYSLKILDISNNKIMNLHNETLFNIISKEDYNIKNNPFVTYLTDD
ncbi:leucine-rich repeat domain-containing protein [Fluviispira sanaruensis]|uniref:Uncharacterized protein n=1 Tax=Fluviispira sanaruensis TaxID=2493639 RepID=A0A4P2VJX3_FLUSA|nr:leucine-rich repeat domain-containing protein [Fluviispira sanaruensis]BBH53041.1 hypothetical protein JCM31447_14840 [Fluviispira sanaruensis]